MHYYYSVYSCEYMHKGLILYDSMKKHDKEFKFFLICLDEKTKAIFNKMKLSDLVVIDIKDIEAYDSEMARVRRWREDKTYTWLVKPAAALYLFDKYHEIDHLLWLDGDTKFLSDPQPIYDEWGNYSVLLTEEKFTDEYFIYSELYGFYNTGLMGFRKDNNALECIRYYREKLILCNFDDYKGSWNDQLYVTDWPQRFNNIGVVKNAGINLTPFITYYRNFRDKGFLINKRGEEFYLHNTKIVLYHFMAVKYINGNEYDLCRYVMDFNEDTIRNIYIPYMKESTEAVKRIRNIDSSVNLSESIQGRYIRNYFNMAANEAKPLINVCTIATADNLSNCIRMYYSLLSGIHESCLWICCMDENSFHVLEKMKLEKAYLIDIKNIEDPEDEKQTEAKRKSSESEYIDIIKPLLIRHILKNNYNINNLLLSEWYENTSIANGN